MIVSRTGYRLSLFGGGTDFESYYKEHGAFLIGGSLNKFCYVTVKALPSFSPHTFEIYYSNVEKVKTLEDIKNPGVRGTLQFLKGQYPELHGLAIYIQNELPAQSGVGSSSALIVGLLNAVYHYLGFTPSKRQLAQNAIHIERVLLKESGGIQDQIFCAYGNISTLTIDKDGYFNVRPLSVSEDFLVKFKKSSVMFYLGGDRSSFDISQSYENKDCLQKKHAIKQLAEYALSSFQKENLTDVGFFLHESWVQKRGISNLISNSYVDEVYNKAVTNGALGGKILGAGGSGFMFCICEDGKKRQELLQAINLPYIEVDFSYEGSKIILI